MQLGLSLSLTGGGGGSGGAAATTYTATIPSGKVSADLTGYPLLIRLSGMPSAFWRRVQSDGGNIRATTAGGTSLPVDVWWINQRTKDGAIVVKTDLASASSNTVKITVGSGIMPAVGSTYGRNAVWSGFDAVFPLAGKLQDHTGGNPALNLGSGDLLKVAAETFSMDVHQGAKWFADAWHAIDTAQIVRYDAAGNELLRDTTLLARAMAMSGITGLDHIGDPAIYQGQFVFPIEKLGTPNTLGSKQCLVWVTPTATGYTVNKVVDTSATLGTGEFGALAYCPVDDLLYCGGFGSDTTLYKFSPVDGSAQGTLTITNATGITLTQIQGLLWWRDAFVVSTNGSRIFRLLSDGTCTGQLYDTTSAGTDSFEGLGEYNGYLTRLRDGRTGGGTARAELIDLLGFTTGGGAAFNLNTGLRSSSRTSRQTFTMGVITSAASATTTYASLSYLNAAALASANRRVTLYITRGSASPIAQGVWDLNNLWLQDPSKSAPTADQGYFIAAKYEGTTQRKFYIDGALKATQSTITIAPNDLDTLLIGYEDDSLSERQVGSDAFAFLTSAALSDAFIAAMGLNYLTPASFYDLA